MTEEFFQSLGSQSTQRQTSVPMAQDSPSFVDDDTIGAIASQQVPKEKTFDFDAPKETMHAHSVQASYLDQTGPKSAVPVFDETIPRQVNQ